jgi:hypothetical protein
MESNTNNNYLKKELYELIKNDESIFDFIQESSLDGMWYWDLKNSENEWMNARFWTTLGYNPEEMPHKSGAWQDIIDQDDLKVALDNFKKHCENPNHAYDQIVRYKHKNGSIVWIRCRGMTIRDEKNKPIRMLGAHHNITELKEVEHELIKAKERAEANERKIKESEIKLKESNITKDKFFSILAHDLKSPFNSMLGFSDILNKEFDKYDTKEQKKFIGIINTSIQNTYKLLENLLLWSLSQRGCLDFKPEKTNLYLLTYETSELLKQSADNKSIKLINRIDENIYIRVDKNMLSTIIRNLLSNAIKFTAQKGKITINSNLLTTDKKQQFVKISVADSGVGISKEIQSKLFDIGENTSTKGTENEKGTGLGLILCKEFVENHEGKIWVESETGKGSIFNFTIPLKTL